MAPLPEEENPPVIEEYFEGQAANSAGAQELWLNPDRRYTDGERLQALHRMADDYRQSARTCNRLAAELEREKAAAVT